MLLKKIKRKIKQRRKQRQRNSHSCSTLERNESKNCVKKRQKVKTVNAQRNMHSLPND